MHLLSIQDNTCIFELILFVFPWFLQNVLYLEANTILSLEKDSYFAEICRQVGVVKELKKENKSKSGVPDFLM